VYFTCITFLLEFITRCGESRSIPSCKASTRPSFSRKVKLYNTFTSVYNTWKFNTFTGVYNTSTRLRGIPIYTVLQGVNASLFASQGENLQHFYACLQHFYEASTVT